MFNAVDHMAPADGTRAWHRRLKFECKSARVQLGEASGELIDELRVQLFAGVIAAAAGVKET